MGNFEIDDEQLFDSLKNEDLYYNKDKELKNDINYQNSKINNFNHLFKIHDILIRNVWFSHGEKTTNEQVPYKHYIY
jgi:hypothetical protein